ncbi:hypothetical protein HDU97_008453, partial [Phlyctochytrium planicorne]
PDCSKFEVCTADFSPVCGSNGKTYSNTCQFEGEKCRLGLSNLSIASQGECKSTKPDCSKFEVCTADFSPVCGSNGKTFSNTCQFEGEKCRLGLSSLTIASQGECKTAKPDCSKFEVCTADFSPVCGSNGKTYSNTCQFEGEKCRLGLSGLTIASQGECKSTKPDCSKFEVCTADFSPVCGSNGKTYSNTCQFEGEKCRLGLSNLSIASQGECKKI